MSINLTPDFLASVAGVVLSLAFSYVPGLRRWFVAALVANQATYTLTR